MNQPPRERLHRGTSRIVYIVMNRGNCSIGEIITDPLQGSWLRSLRAGPTSGQSWLRH